MEQIAGWVAPIATMLAAMMTAANLGARITGWGFVVFTVGSIAWSVVAIVTGQANLLWTNGFLTFVNLVGIWRWLGRQARYDDGGEAAAARSAAARTPSLFPIGALAGARLVGRDGAPIATVIEGMMRCSDASLAYLVVSEGGVAGVGERLHALPLDELSLAEGTIACRLTAQELEARPVLDTEAWPASAGEVRQHPLP
ncbi:PRC-barrel domain containing protein [Sphingomonas quercus]|nr:PRC-barrel domain containing protein [Sphingomonas quercus]